MEDELGFGIDSQNGFLEAYTNNGFVHINSDLTVHIFHNGECIEFPQSSSIPDAIDVANKWWKPVRIKEEIVELNPEALFADGLESALIGYTKNTCEPVRAIYDSSKCIEALQSDADSDSSYEDAVEYFEFNTLGAYVGVSGPIFI